MTEVSSKCVRGGNGGNGGVQLNLFKEVSPGQEISYSIGSGGSAGRTNYSELFYSYTNSGNGGTTVFGNLSASGGQGGSTTASGSSG